jgi:hypothetical protein
MFSVADVLENTGCDNGIEASIAKWEPPPIVAEKNPSDG